MKKIIFSLLLISTCLVFFACQEDETTGELIRKLKLELEFSDFSSLPVNSFPYTNRYFSPQNEARNFLPEWLISKYFMAKDGSEAIVSYDFINYDKPIELVSISGKDVIEILDHEYKDAWGDIVADFYTPSHSPEENVPKVLNQYYRPDEGDYQVVEYRYSPIEATILSDQPTIVFKEDFSGPNARDWGLVNSPVWFNKIMEGSGRGWSYIFNKVPSSPNIFSYNRTAGADSWLVTNAPIDMSDGKGFELSLDFGWGYSLADRMFNFHVMVSENFDGVDPRNAEWTDITDDFVATLPDQSKVRLNESVKVIPSVGYPGIRTYRTENPELFKGKKLHIALRDKLLPVKTNGTVYSSSPLYFIDNVNVTKLVDFAVSEVTEKQYGLFKYVNGRWMKTDEFYILQPKDYLLIGQPFLSITNSHLFIPELLNNILDGNDGDRKIVVYLTEDGKTNAEDYIFSNGTWKPNSPPVIKKKDKYVFDSSDMKWHFDSQL